MSWMKNRFGVGCQVVLDGNAQQVIPGQFASDDEERILQIDLVLEGIPLVGEFAEGEKGKLAGPVAFIGDLQRQYSKVWPSGTK